jgi:hypothetical protein
MKWAKRVAAVGATVVAGVREWIDRIDSIDGRIIAFSTRVGPHAETLSVHLPRVTLRMRSSLLFGTLSFSP